MLGRSVLGASGLAHGDLLGPWRLQPAPPPSRLFDWGDESRVTQLLGDAFELSLTGTRR
jgi:hypothetical protein